MNNRIDVLIVGAGPTGLTAAGILARYGIHFRIIDKSAGPAIESRAIGVQARTLELWDKLGLADSAIRDGQPLTALNLLTRPRVTNHHRQHDGKPFLVLGRDGDMLTPYPYLLIYEQYKTEEMLIADLGQQTVAGRSYSIERNTEIVALQQTDDIVQVTVRDGHGNTERISTQWLIAADGASSFVRHSLALDFAGATYPDSLFVADVDMEWSLARDKFYVEIPRHGMLAYFPMRGAGYSNNQYRVLGRLPTEMTDKKQLTADDIQYIIDKYSVVGARISATRWTSIYRIHRRMVKEFRVGRIFLAGDAAHIHSPAGGQGMNTGIQDAWNLAWKLALVVRGEADVALLASYTPERLPVAKAILNGSDQGFSFISSPNYFLHLFRILLMPLLSGLAAKAQIGNRIFNLVSQTWISYRDSAAVAGELRRAVAQPGDRAPHALFTTGPHAGTSIFTVLRGVEHHLLLFADGSANAETLHSQVKSLLAPYALRIHIHLIDSTQRLLYKAYGVTTPTAFLIRPDGHIAWRGSVNQLAELTAYLDRFFSCQPIKTAEFI